MNKAWLIRTGLAIVGLALLGLIGWGWYQGGLAVLQLGVGIC
ncbi:MULTISPECIES: hypothetical protein [Pseudomonas]|uniref:Uncharacterized protein n=1 Tax=Pseudomonas segetis TaxID=298908 RepID=A0A238ZW63_9PSED|nr:MULTISPECIES: hypothetical protein [Pseudomonas]SNR87231.1 hypothetical protein SAMN05216255_0719 [Pseudomonas segetis]